MPNVILKRLAALAGLIGVIVAGMALLTPVAAQAKVANPPHGSQPGSLTLNPAAGDGSTKATWSTTTPCQNRHQNQAYLAAYDNGGTPQQLSVPVASPGGNPIASKPMLGTMAGLFDVLGPAPDTFEFVVVCQATVTDRTPVQSIFVTVKADGTWTTSATPPGGTVKKTSSMTASSPTLWATVLVVILLLVGAFFGGRWLLRSRRVRNDETVAAAVAKARRETVEQLRNKAAAGGAKKGGSG
jgi:hypothetical protein